MRTLYVTDLDGTLLDNRSLASDSSQLMLNRAVERGAMFTVATARTPATVDTLMRGIDMRLPGVVITGCAYYDFRHRRLLDPRVMKESAADRLVGEWRESGLSAFVYTINAEGILEVYHIGPLSDLERTFISERDKTPVKRFYVPESGESVLPSRLDNVMLFFGLQPTEPAHELYEKLKAEMSVAEIAPQFYHDIYGDAIGELEIFPAGVSKASALEKLASDLAADRLVVFGDNVNDIPMMRLADEAIAVANAKEEVKAVATAVIGPNTDDAVARFILNETL